MMLIQKTVIIVRRISLTTKRGTVWKKLAIQKKDDGEEEIDEYHKRRRIPTNRYDPEVYSRKVCPKCAQQQESSSSCAPDNDEVAKEKILDSRSIEKNNSTAISGKNNVKKGKPVSGKTKNKKMAKKKQFQLLLLNRSDHGSK
mmetsp:Transcript_13725/g.15729  ORF Transcript_13725/g.15729 Transcript_13725/m.15729 type:complete len:143 (+) Transcript_13725:2125-2553(+)